MFNPFATSDPDPSAFVLLAVHLQAAARTAWRVQFGGKFNQLPVDWQTETLITVGATEAIAAVLMGVLNAGDEVSCDGLVGTAVGCPGCLSSWHKSGSCRASAAARATTSLPVERDSCNRVI